MHYVAASGMRLPNVGQQAIKFLTENGIWAAWTFQVAGINKPLVSVSKLIDDRWGAVFDDEASYLLHKPTGQRIEFRRERGVFVVDAYVDPAKEDKVNEKSGFTRQD